MPDLLVAVAGTGTDIGKTWVTAQLARALRRNFTIAARKPAQSCAFDQPMAERDAAILAAATGEDPNDVCPPQHCYPLAMAPPMAASALGMPPISIAALTKTLQWPEHTDIGFIETAGGVRSPIAHDGDNVDLINATRPDLVLLVADAALGTINLVRLCLAALHPHEVVVMLNRYNASNELHQRNRHWLSHHDGATIHTTIEQAANDLRERIYTAHQIRPGRGALDVNEPATPSPDIA